MVMLFRRLEKMLKEVNEDVKEVREDVIYYK